MNGSMVEDYEADVVSRLAVIENKLQTLIVEVSSVREYIPAKMVEHNERIGVVERHIRTIGWAAGVFASTMVGALIAHIFGK